MWGEVFGPSGGPDWGSTQNASVELVVDDRERGIGADLQPSATPGQVIVIGHRTPVKQSSHGPGGTATTSPLGIPAASRRSIPSAAKSSSATSPDPSTRRNHGCHPTVAGKAAPAACTSTRCAR